MIADAQFGAGLAGEQAAVITHVDDAVLRGALRLAVEQAGYGCHGIELELLVGIKMQFHDGLPGFNRLAARSKSLSKLRSCTTRKRSYSSSASFLATS